MADKPQEIPITHLSREVYIPERWVEKEVRDIEPDVPYVLPMKIDNPYSPVKDSLLFVDEKGKLLLAGNLVVDDAYRKVKGADVVDGFGLMRTYEPYTGDMKEGFIVDLRNVNPGEIERIDISKMPDDEEDLGGWLTFVAALIPVQAVILPRREYEDMDPELSKAIKTKISGAASEQKPKYNIQGYAAFYPALQYLATELDNEGKRQREQAKKIKKDQKKKSPSKEMVIHSTTEQPKPTLGQRALQLVSSAFRRFDTKE